MEIDWLYLHEEWDWLGHILEALVMALVVAALLFWVNGWRLALLLGLAFATGHFHGREKRDYEISVGMPPPHLEGHYLWRWNWDQITDFWPVVIVLGVIGYWLARKRG